MEEQEDMVGRPGPGGPRETTGSSGLGLQGGGVKGVVVMFSQFDESAVGHHGSCSLPHHAGGNPSDPQDTNPVMKLLY